MEIQVHTDHSAGGTRGLVRDVQQEVSEVLRPFTDHLTSVLVHVGNESAKGRGVPDIRCMIEVKPARHQPVAVTHHATTTQQAISGAAQEMHDVLASLFGRLNDRHPGAPTIRGRRSAPGANRG